MEPGTTEVLRVVAAITSAFQTAADTLSMIQDRKERRKRKREKEVEELMEIRILHKSLIEGATRCRKHCEDKHQQFSPAFEAGDDIALLALKDIVISLQADVIQPLQIAGGVENAVLDFTNFHESSVTSRKDATRAMDQLCQRIMASMQFQQQHGENTSEAINPSDSSMRSSFQSMHLSEVNESPDLPPSPPTTVGSPRQPFNQRATPQRTLTIRRSSDKAGVRSKPNASQASPLGWISSQVNQNSSNPTAGNTSSSAASEEQQSYQQDQQSYQRPDDSELERRSQFSIQPSVFGSDDGSVHMQPVNITSTTISRYKQDPYARFQTAFEQPPPHFRPRAGSTEQAVSAASETHRRNFDGSLGEEAEALYTLSEKRKASTPLCLPRIETAHDLQRAFEAPEVISTDFEGMYTMSPLRDQFPEKYPAFLTQADYAERLLSLPIGMDNIWMPLKRPAMHNRYHGFCKGAWQTRKVVHEGLEVKLTPSLKEPVLHWTCKECKFRSQAPNLDALPSQIMFNQKYGIRFRFLFLAKSHRATETSCASLENYKYGCIFCAAQGQTTAVHDRLDHLMVHIISKHKSRMMSSEVREKTKCVVGSVVDQAEDWDINIPESNQKGAGVVADEFLISASKFFSRRKGKRSLVGA